MRIRHLREGTKMKGRKGWREEGRKEESKEARKEGVKKQEKEGRRQRTKRSTRKEEEWKRSVFRNSALRISRGCKAACKNSQPFSLGTLFDTDVLWNLFERHPKSNQKKYSRAPSALCNSCAKRRQSAWRPTKGSKRVLLQTQTAALKSQSEDHTGTDSWPKILLPTHCGEKVPRQALYLQSTRGHRRQQSKWQENSAASAAHNSASASLARKSRICQANERILYIAACDFHSKNLYRWWSAMIMAPAGLPAGHITDPSHKVGNSLRLDQRQRFPGHTITVLFCNAIGDPQQQWHDG